jgi:septal ring factor EnvC (AmiA/AmiB activator)
VIRFAILILAVLGVGLPALARNPSREDINRLHQRIERLQQQYRSSVGDQKDATDALRESEKAISATRRKLRNLTLQQQKTRDNIEQIGRQINALNVRIASQRQNLSQLLVNMYKHNRSDRLQMLLNGQDPNQLSRNLHYLDDVSRAQHRLIDSLRADLQKSSELQKAEQAKSQELDQIRSHQQRTQAKLYKEKQSRQQVLAGISETIKSQRRQIATLKRNAERLTHLFERLEAQRRERQRKEREAREASKRKRAKESGTREKKGVMVTEIPERGQGAGVSFVSLKGSLRLPVKGELMNRFGTPMESGGPDWKGVFIRTAPGAEVHAVAPGTVVFSDWIRGFGNLIILDHGQGYMSLYSNNESLYKQVGDTVQTGDVIAVAGDSGGQPDTGVYFELRHKSRPINPMEWVK